jgi:hypothetical protein
MGPVFAFEASSIIGESTREAHTDARTWLVGMSTTNQPAADEASAPGTTAEGDKRLDQDFDPEYYRPCANLDGLYPGLSDVSLDYLTSGAFMPRTWRLR